MVSYDLKSIDKNVRVDSEIPGAGSRNLVQIDLAKSGALANSDVILNVYAMVTVSGTIASENPSPSPLKDAAAPAPPPAPGAARLLPPENVLLRIWKEPGQQHRVSLPHTMQAANETFFVEGLKAGRYRLVLLYSDRKVAAGQIKAKEQKPNAAPAPVGIKLVIDEKTDYPFPPDNVRLTVAKVDIHQKNFRDHVFDVLWNGRAMIDARLWPPTGIYCFSQQFAATDNISKAQWMNVSSSGTFAPLPTPRTQPAAATPDISKVAAVRGGFVVQRTSGNNSVVQGPGLYDARLSLQYDVEGVSLTRRAPLTIVIPHHVHVSDWGTLADPKTHLYTSGTTRDGTNTEILFKIGYQLFDQNNRRITGMGNDDTFKQQYGAKLRMWEALDGVRRGTDLLTQRRLDNHDVPQIDWVFTLNGPTQLGTVPRQVAVPFNKDDEFHDTFGVKLDSKARTFYDEKLTAKEDKLPSGATILDVVQDVICVIDNGDLTDGPVAHGAQDVRVGRNNRLQIVGPTLNSNGTKGPIKFRMNVGTLDGNVPVMVPSDHHPGPIAE